MANMTIAEFSALIVAHEEFARVTIRAALALAAMRMQVAVTDAQTRLGPRPDPELLRLIEFYDNDSKITLR